MAIGSGLGGSVGIVAESTYGTYVAPSRFLEVTKAPFQRKPNFAQGAGLAAGQAFLRSGLLVTTHREGALSLEAEMRNKGFGLLLAHLLGSSATPVQQAATIAYLQTHLWGDNFGKSLTAQVGVPNTAGTVVPYSLTGCKVTGAEFSCGVGELLTAKWDLDAQDYTDATGLAAPSYVAGQRPFHHGQMALKMGTFGAEASVTGVRKVTVKMDRPQKVDRFYAGGAGKKAEPVWNDRPKVSGSVEVDLVNKADFVDRAVTGTAVSLVWEFVGPIIASAYAETFRVSFPAVVFKDGEPSLDGPDVVGAKLDFDVLYDDTNPAVKVEYMSTDTTV